jgi:hypothetical protein
MTTGASTRDTVVYLPGGDAAYVELGPLRPEPPSRFGAADLEKASVVWSYRFHGSFAVAEGDMKTMPIAIAERRVTGDASSPYRWSVVLGGVATDVSLNRPRAGLQLLRIDATYFLRHISTGKCYELVPEFAWEDVTPRGPDQPTHYRSLLVRYRTRALADTGRGIEAPGQTNPTPTPTTATP